MDCQEPVTGRRTGQLVLDYLTDAVLSHKPSLTGEPHVVPDSSLAVTVDTHDHVKIVVQKVTGKSCLDNKQRLLFILYYLNASITQKF